MSNRDSMGISLVAAECKTPVEQAAPTEEKLRAAFKAARKHWMILDDTKQFKGALAAVLSDLGLEHPDHQRLANEIANVGKLNALMHAAQAGLLVEMPEIDVSTPPFGIVGMWRDAQGETK